MIIDKDRKLPRNTHYIVAKASSEMTVYHEKTEAYTKACNLTIEHGCDYVVYKSIAETGLRTLVDLHDDEEEL
ncbi:MAG TPA: hypothetical protein DCE71_07865 [Parachlamydiales bacterium]|nr:hypothetical protein [Parachlamydiales bacterium]